MKKLFTLLIALALVGCSITKQPEFKEITRIDVKNISMRNVTIEADAVFNNPNILKGKVTIEDLHIFVDDIDVGVVSSQEFDVPARAEFTIPLQGQFSLAQIYAKNKKGFLGNILNVLTTDSLQIQYKGKLRYHLGSFSYPYTIEEKQNISLK